MRATKRDAISANRDGEGEGQEEGSDEALDERQRNEDDYSGHCGGEYRRADLRGGFERGAPSLPPGPNVTIDIFEYDYGVVHDAPYGDGEPAEGHEIERHVLP